MPFYGVTPHKWAGPSRNKQIFMLYTQCHSMVRRARNESVRGNAMASTAKKKGEDKWTLLPKAVNCLRPPVSTVCLHHVLFGEPSIRSSSTHNLVGERGWVTRKLLSWYRVIFEKVSFGIFIFLEASWFPRKKKISLYRKQRQRAISDQVFMMSGPCRNR